ncbi:MAG: minor capsid protein [Verrucomicrobia bacterium]|nr:minor capsid protein [Verrucomicrobiota bacterium]
MPDQFIFKPTPHKDAIKLLKGKPAVTRKVFDKLLPELRARAFVITGIEHAGVLRHIREMIAELPAGGDWDKIKDQIVAEASPFFVDPNAEKEIQEKQVQAAENRAELLLRTHGFQAYQAAQYEVMDRQRDVFPYWQYLTMGDEKVRASHAALNNVVLPANHPFWSDHFPPWNFNCRCQVVPISEDDYQDIKDADQGKLPEERNVISGTQLSKLENEGTLFRAVDGAPAQNFDVRSPRDQATTQEDRLAAFQWDPGSLRLDAAQLKARYTNADGSVQPEWTAFEGWSQTQPINKKGTTVWQWISGGGEDQAGEEPPQTPPPTAPTPVPASPTSAPETKPEPEKPEKPEKTKTSDGWPKLDALSKVKDLGGSTGAELMQDTGGKLYVMKRGNSAAHIRSESKADEMYRVLGVNVPDVKLYATPSGPVKLSAFVEGKPLGEYLRTAGDVEKNFILAKVRENFVADALLGNYDVAGLSLDNILVGPRGEVWRIDNGGSLSFRAQGARKVFGNEVRELETMLDGKINPSASKVFSGITEKEIAAQSKDILERREALLAATPAALRETMAARLDDLERIASGKSKATAAPVVAQKPGEFATPEFAEAAKKSRIVGKAAKVDRSDIEDAQALVWTEQDANGKTVTRAKLKLTESGSMKVMERLRDSLPKTAAATADGYWPSIEKAVKTVNTHAGDGSYNKDSLAGMVKTKSELEALKPKTPAAQAMKAHYLDMISQVEEAQKSKTATPRFEKFEPPPDTSSPSTEFNVSRRSVEYAAKKTERGFARAEKQKIYKNEAYVVDMGDAKVVFAPYRDASGGDFSAPYAVRGTMEIVANGDVSTERLQTIRDKIAAVGLDTTDTTPEYRELVYLRKGLAIRSDKVDRAEVDAVVNDASLDDKAKVARLKEMAKDKLKVKLPDKSGEGYNPTGHANAFGEGWGVTERWDLPREKVENEMTGYTLHHNIAGNRLAFFESVLSGGGDLTATTERLRKGVPITAGMSVSADLDSGGANYIYTRIKKSDRAYRTPGVTFKVGNLARQDAFSFRGDWFSGIHSLEKPEIYKSRGKTISDFKRIAEGGSNETIFKWGINMLSEVDAIVAESPAERKAILEIFRRHKYATLPDGRNIEDVVKSRG